MLPPHLPLSYVYGCVVRTAAVRTAAPSRQEYSADSVRPRYTPVSPICIVSAGYCTLDTTVALPDLRRNQNMLRSTCLLS